MPDTARAQPPSFSLSRWGGAAQGIAVGGPLDGRVALDAGAQTGIVAVGEKEMGHRGFGSDERQGGLQVSRRSVEKFQFASR